MPLDVRQWPKVAAGSYWEFLWQRHMRRRHRRPSTAFILASATDAQNSSQSLTCNWVWVSAAQPPAAHQWDQSFVLWSCSSSLPLPPPSTLFSPSSSAPPSQPSPPPQPRKDKNRHLSHSAIHRQHDSDKYCGHGTAADVVDTEPSRASLAAGLKYRISKKERKKQIFHCSLNFHTVFYLQYLITY